MKTLTEFFATSLKAAQKAKEELVAAGKTAEELTAALGEQLKLEGDKLTRMISALDAVESRWDDLKRVVVLGLGEGEKAPAHARMVGELVFVVEHYAPLNVKKAPQESHRRGRDGKKGRGGRGDRSKGGGGRSRSPRGANDSNRSTPVTNS